MLVKYKEEKKVISLSLERDDRRKEYKEEAEKKKKMEGYENVDGF